MKVIFLDIDGVLATPSSYGKPDQHIPHYLGDKWARRGFHGIDMDCIRRLNKITDETGARIVVSSTWRHGTEEDFSDLISYLHQCGVRGSIIGRTGSRRQYMSAYRGPYYQRGDECQDWVDEHPEVTNFVCIDDDSDFDNVKDNFVQVPLGWYNDEGMLDEHADKAIEILQGDTKA